MKPQYKDEPTSKKLITEPEHIKNMSFMDIHNKLLLLGIVKEDRKPALRHLIKYGALNNDLLGIYKISIDWVGDVCVCYPFQNSDEVNEQKALLSISDENMSIAIAKAVIWKVEETTPN